MSRNTTLARLAWGTLIFNLAVIVWGAFVRASGSGAGCGSHWPLCNGSVIPDVTLSKTAIEFAHRVTSGGSLILSAAIAWLGVRQNAKGSRVRRAALGVLGFTLSEAVIGAGLVLLDYVEHDKSVGRVISISLHLSNTFMLLAALSLTAWWSSFAPPARVATRKGATIAPHAAMRPAARAPSRLTRLMWISLAVTTLVGMTGAITALGDTLLQSGSIAGGLVQTLSATSHFLLKLRVIHPFLAVATAALLFYFAETVAESVPAGNAEGARARRLTLVLKTLVALQIALGATNLLLHAPMGLQLAHLFLAECLWISLVLVSVAAMSAFECAELGALDEVAPGLAVAAQELGGAHGPDGAQPVAESATTC
jgi:heme A synthase